MSNIFISYKSEQRSIAFTIRDKLHEWGYETWLDVDKLQPGTYWANEINKALKTCHICLAIMTPLSIGSRYVTNEWDMVIMQGKLFLPLMFEYTEPHYKYIDIQYIDFTVDDKASSFLRLQARLASYNKDNYETPASKDPYRDYLQGLYERINKYLSAKLIATLHNEKGQIEPIQLSVERAEGAVDVLFEKREEIDPLFVIGGIESMPQREFHDFGNAVEYFHGRVLLLGDPGAGKTIALLNYARDAVVRRFQDLSAPLPILAIIPTWDAEEGIFNWIENSFGSPSETKKIIENGGALLLLDGLDELGREHLNKRTNIKSDPRQSFLVQIPSNNQIIVTSRTQDYEEIGEAIALNGAVTLMPLNDSQMEMYLLEQRELWQAIQADERLKLLLKTPLLLSFFAFAYQDDLDGEERAKLMQLNREVVLRDKIFERYIQKRYEHEERKRNLRGGTMLFSLSDLKTLLGQIAMNLAILKNETSLRLNVNGNTVSIIFGNSYFNSYNTSQSPYVQFSELLNLALELQFLTKTTVNIDEYRTNIQYQFTHNLLRDYFATVYCFTYLDDADMYENNLANPAETLGMLGDIRAFAPLQKLLRDRETANSIRSNAAFALGILGKNEAVPDLISALGDESELVREAAAYTLGGLKDIRAVDPLIAALSDTEIEVQIGAAQSLGNLNANKSIRELIKLLEYEDNEGYLIVVIAEALAKIGDKSAIEPLTRFMSDTRTTRLMTRVCDEVSSALELLGATL
jgi:HEAT repeat protein